MDHLCYFEKAVWLRTTQDPRFRRPLNTEEMHTDLYGDRQEDIRPRRIKDQRPSNVHSTIDRDHLPPFPSRLFPVQQKGAASIVQQKGAASIVHHT